MRHKKLLKRARPKLTRGKVKGVRKISLYIVIIIFSFGLLWLLIGRPRQVLNLKVIPEEVVNNDFYGFGVETLPWLWGSENKKSGVNEKDIMLNIQRIKDMRLPMTRIFVPWETWNPSGDYKTFTWQSDKMESLYKTLDIYQEMGTEVILVTVDWFLDSPWKNVRGSSRAVLTLLEYLIKDRGYSCIHFWSLTNEPELTYNWLKKMPFKKYTKINRLVKKGLKKKRLPVKIIASDEVESKEWFDKSVKSLRRVSDIFSSHLYLYPEDAYLTGDFFRERLDSINRVSYHGNKIPFFIGEFGFRGHDFGTNTNNIMKYYKYGLYVADFCIDALNSGVDSASLWCLHHIRIGKEIDSNGNGMMRIGLWGYKDEGWRPFPVFYLYQLFTRYIRSDSRVLKTGTDAPGPIKFACVERNGSYSLFIANLTDKKQAFSVKGLNSAGIDFKKYIYSRMEIAFSGRNALKPKKEVIYRGYIQDTIPPKSVILYTNLKDD